MPKFKIETIDAQGVERRYSVTATDEADALAKVKANGLFTSKIEEIPEPIIPPPIPSPTPKPPPDPARRKNLTRLACAYAAGVLTMSIVWIAWPKTDLERMVLGNSPQYMLAALDLQEKLPSNHEKVKFYAFMLSQTDDLFEDETRHVAWMVSSLVSRLNEEGYPCDAFSVLNSSIEAAKKTRDKKGLFYKKFSYRVFTTIYETFRRSMKLSHYDSIQRIIDLEKLD